MGDRKNDRAKRMKGEKVIASNRNHFFLVTCTKNINLNESLQKKIMFVLNS